MVVVIWPGRTVIEVRIRPLRDLASTIHGRGGSDAGSISGTGAPAG
jgi:hypothetical protein